MRIRLTDRLTIMLIKQVAIFANSYRGILMKQT
jgi:hypothetical protein